MKINNLTFKENLLMHSNAITNGRSKPFKFNLRAKNRSVEHQNMFQATALLSKGR
ncbi:hypothetical protein [Kurthia sp. Dielmo]|uniref:hypothetical protein n=1 Tax=Kurthia sp. Dielmo TaxID=1033738 RepID=UPI0016488D1E|nr:hypothetical protein [Kurthia sp. Dielmo]